MADLQQMTMDIAASLWVKPCKFEELKKIDVLKNKSEYGVSLLIQMAEEKGFIYERNDTYYCYKKTVKQTLNPNGYGLDEKEKIEESEFIKAFNRSIKNLA